MRASGARTNRNFFFFPHHDLSFETSSNSPRKRRAWTPLAPKPCREWTIAEFETIHSSHSTFVDMRTRHSGDWFSGANSKSKIGIIYATHTGKRGRPGNKKTRRKSERGGVEKGGWGGRGWENDSGEKGDGASSPGDRASTEIILREIEETYCKSRRALARAWSLCESGSMTSSGIQSSAVGRPRGVGVGGRPPHMRARKTINFVPRPNYAATLI